MQKFGYKQLKLILVRGEMPSHRVHSADCLNSALASCLSLFAGDVQPAHPARNKRYSQPPDSVKAISDMLEARQGPSTPEEGSYGRKTTI
jgi:hypothetical protein